MWEMKVGMYVPQCSVSTLSHKAISIWQSIHGWVAAGKEPSLFALELHSLVDGRVPEFGLEEVFPDEVLGS